MRTHTGTVLIRVLVGILVGTALSFPASIAWYFEWSAKYPGDVAWGLWMMVALGAVGGAVFRIVAGLKPQPRMWLRVASAVMVVGPSAALMVYFAVFFVSL